MTTTNHVDANLNRLLDEMVSVVEAVDRAVASAARLEQGKLDQYIPGSTDLTQPSLTALHVLFQLRRGISTLHNDLISENEGDR